MGKVKAKSGVKKEPKAPKGPQECQICGKVFDSGRRFSEHKTYHKRKEKVKAKRSIPQKCEVCGKMIVYHLKRHMEEVHGDKLLTQLFKCDQPNCDFASPRKANLKKHLLGTHLAKGQVKVDLVCKVCNEVFPASNKKADNLYYKHYREKHNDLPPEYKDKELFLCSDCPDVFINKDAFSRHVYRHKNEKSEKEKRMANKGHFFSENSRSPKIT